MFDALIAFTRKLSPAYRRILAKRRLEQVAIEAGASRSVSKKIVATYFAKTKNVAQ